MIYGQLSICFPGGDLLSLGVYGALPEIAKKYIALDHLSRFSCQPTYFVLIWARGRHQKAHKPSGWGLMDGESKEEGRESSTVLPMLAALQNGMTDHHR